jgi:AcrR family transcriptional regulator
MPRPAKAGRYHHGDLRAALIETAVELIADSGVHGFSLAEASRRLGVAASAPYAHFADRDELLAAVAVRAYETFSAQLEPAIRVEPEPGRRLAAIAAAYVRFAGANRPLFAVLLEGGIDKARHPEVAAAERPIDDAFRDCVRALSAGDDLAVAVEATAHGHAALLLDGALGDGVDAIERAADSAARATLALVESRGLLRPRRAVSP